MRRCHGGLGLDSTQSSHAMRGCHGGLGLHSHNMLLEDAMVDQVYRRVISRNLKLCGIDKINVWEV